MTTTHSTVHNKCAEIWIGIRTIQIIQVDFDIRLWLILWSRPTCNPFEYYYTFLCRKFLFSVRMTISCALCLVNFHPKKPKWERQIAYISDIIRSVDVNVDVWVRAGESSSRFFGGWRVIAGGVFIGRVDTINMHSIGSGTQRKNMNELFESST